MGGPACASGMSAAHEPSYEKRLGKVEHDYGRG
jgi:hypothetical protein